MTDAETAEYVSSFEETLQRFMGLSSEEIWELQRILMRRVKCKLSETLSPEGKTAMKEVKQEMHERQLYLEKMAMSSATMQEQQMYLEQMAVSSATLVTELFDLGSKAEVNPTSQNDPPKDIIVAITDNIIKPADDNNQQTDVIDKVANDNKTEQSKTHVEEVKDVKEKDVEEVTDVKEKDVEEVKEAPNESDLVISEQSETGPDTKTEVTAERTNSRNSTRNAVGATVEEQNETLDNGDTLESASKTEEHRENREGQDGKEDSSIAQQASEETVMKPEADQESVNKDDNTSSRGEDSSEKRETEEVGTTT